MPDLEPPAWLRSWVATSLNSSVYAAVGASIGAILSVAAPFLGGDPWHWFFAGTCIPTGPMYLLFTSDWRFRRRLLNLKRLFDEGLITQELYELDRERAMTWRRERLFGKMPELPRAPERPKTPKQPRETKSAPRKPAKPAVTAQPGEAPVPQAEGQPEGQRESQREAT